MTTMLSQLGLIDEVAYGTPLTPTRFFEFNRYAVKLDQGRVQSEGLRSGGRVRSSLRTEPFRKGAMGSVELDVPTKGFGILLRHMLGAISSSAVVDGNTTHTATVGSLLGDSFTLQGNKPFNPSGTNQAVTLHGCKVAGWELACDVDGLLVCTLDIDAEDEDTSTALATATYPTDYRVFTFAGAAVTVAGSSVEVKNFRVSCDNGLDTDRRYMRNNPLKKEPVENAYRDIEWSFTADWENLTQYDRFRSATRAGMFASIIATFLGPIAHGGATLPMLEIEMPACRFDDLSNDIDGPAALMQDVSGVALWDQTNSPITIRYRTTDATP